MGGLMERGGDTMPGLLVSEGGETERLGVRDVEKLLAGDTKYELGCRAGADVSSTLSIGAASLNVSVFGDALGWESSAEGRDADV